MLVIGFDFLLVIVGLLIFLLSNSPKIPEVGKIMFFCGLLAIALGMDKVVALVH